MQKKTLSDWSTIYQFLVEIFYCWFKRELHTFPKNIFIFTRITFHAFGKEIFMWNILSWFFFFNQFSLVANPFVLCFWPNVGEPAKKFRVFLNVLLTVSFRSLFELASFVELWKRTYSCFNISIWIVIKEERSWCR